jgi:hypothetical protein
MDAVDLLINAMIHNDNYYQINIDKLEQNYSLTSFIFNCKDTRIEKIMARNRDNFRFKSIKVAPREFAYTYTNNYLCMYIKINRINIQ